MLKQGKGNIVNISSVVVTGVNQVLYSAAGGGVSALARSIVMECSDNGIRINAVVPGGMEVPLYLTSRNDEQPSEREKTRYQQVVDQTVASSLMHRYGTLAEQVNTILLLTSDEASYITGVTLPMAGDDLGQRRVAYQQSGEPRHTILAPYRKDHDSTMLSNIAIDTEESAGMKYEAAASRLTLLYRMSMFHAVQVNPSATETIISLMTTGQPNSAGG